VTDGPRPTLVSVYRRTNAERLARLIEPALAARWTVALWALDEPDTALEALTVGVGPGTKFQLVNRLVSERRVAGDLVVADDDTSFADADVVAFLERVRESDFGIAQPAHVRRSHTSHRITPRRPSARARWTTFVEIGPLFAVTSTWFPRAVPFREDGMGWGVELDWMDLQPDGCRLGIIDATPIDHVGPVGGGYDAQAELDRLLAELEARGHPHWRGLRKTLATWWAWRGEPPWLEPQRAPGKSGTNPMP
jgi:hypothetical protein